MKEEGWYVDPYRLHEARWFSDGTPTALVRDKGTTSQDPAPSAPYLAEPEAIPESVSSADDVRSADGSDQSRDPVDAIWTIFTESPSV